MVMDLNNTAVVQDILAYIDENKERLHADRQIFDILEGDLMSKVEDAIDNQLSGKSAQVAKKRIPPVNILRKVVNRLTRLYSRSITRTTPEARDQVLIDVYTEALKLDENMGDVNYNYNGYKYASLKIVEKTPGQLSVMPVTPTQFLPYNAHPMEPTRIDAMIEHAGQVDDENKYWVYTEDQFISITESGKLVAEDMEENEGVNPFGVIPFTYAASSKYLLVPRFDADMVQMPVLIPLLMAEVNFGMQFLANPIIYGINLSMENMQASANAVWNIKTDDVDGANASLNVLQPNMDIENQSKWISEDLLASWLESKDIRAEGSQGSENAVSGVNLIIREMNTVENVKRQAKVFANVEQDFWNRLATMHNTLVEAGRLDAAKFSSDTIEVTVEYADPKPLEDRNIKVDTATKEIDAGILSKKRAVMRLNDMDETEAEKLLEEITDEKDTASLFLNMAPVSTDGIQQEGGNETDQTN